MCIRSGDVLLTLLWLENQKLTIGGPAEKIVSAFHAVLSEHTNEEEEMNKCKSTVHRVKKMEKDVDMALTTGTGFLKLTMFMV